MSKVLYLIGSLRNERIPVLAERIRKELPNFEVFDDWYSAGPEADDHWKSHQISKGLSYQDALNGHAAKNVFAFDKRHLDRASHALLVLPAGKSGHMEIMYAAYGVGANAAILLDPEDVRWDVMYQFVPTILNNDEEINEWLMSSPAPAKGIASPSPKTTKSGQIIPLQTDFLTTFPTPLPRWQEYPSSQGTNTTPENASTGSGQKARTIGTK